MEDNPLNANSEAQIAGDAMECRMGEVIVGSGLLSGPPTTPLTAPREVGDAVRSDWPRAWGGSNAPTDWRSVGDPTPRNRRAPVVRPTSPADRGTDVTEMKGSSQPARKTALQVDRFTKPSQLGSAIDFEHAYRMYSRRVYAKCLHMVGNEAEAEDLTQEVFLQLFRKMDSFRGESAFATWLYRVAVNVVLMRLRRKSLITSSLEEVTELKEGISSLHQVLGAPDRALTTAIDRLNLERAVSQMPAGYRQVFLLHYVEGYEHREIARILGFDNSPYLSCGPGASAWTVRVVTAVALGKPMPVVNRRRWDGHGFLPGPHGDPADDLGGVRVGAPIGRSRHVEVVRHERRRSRRRQGVGVREGRVLRGRRVP